MWWGGGQYGCEALCDRRVIEGVTEGQLYWEGESTAPVME